MGETVLYSKQNLLEVYSRKKNHRDLLLVGIQSQLPESQV